MRKLFQRRPGRVLFAAAVTAFVFGLWSGTTLGKKSGKKQAGKTADAGVPQKKKKAIIWTCPMHPEVRLPSPGKCPKCGMTLVPAGQTEEAGPRRIVLSERAIKTAETATAKVERRYVEHEFRTVGAVAYDETRLAVVQAWVGGRIERLFVDYVGVPVNKGEHMFLMYSPEILVAEGELLQARRAFQAASPGTARQSADDVLTATREKLRLWGLTPAQIAAVEKRGRPADHILITAPLGGIVVKKHVVEGAYVKTGSPVYTIADLSHVWVLLDAYESDLPWVYYGQEAEFEAKAFPGRIFTGRVVFISPVVDPKTRTVKVRVNVANPRRQLKPDMFVHAVLRAKVDAAGEAVRPVPGGRFICPMHPEIVKDTAGKCDLCGMPLVPVEKMGLTGRDAGPPLILPATAPLLTGKRAVVYVQVPGRRKPTYEGRVVRLGPRAGDYYVVLAGLKEGETVVTKGSFKIDAAVQLEAKPGMMAVADDTETPAAPRPAALSAAFRGKWQAVLVAYLGLQKALSEGADKQAATAAAAFSAALKEAAVAPPRGPGRAVWIKEISALTAAAGTIAKAADLKERRKPFAALAGDLTKLAAAFGNPLAEPLFRAHCPMAFGGKGADWLQLGRKVRNPYYGPAMSGCGEIKGETPPAMPAPPAPPGPKAAAGIPNHANMKGMKPEKSKTPEK